MLKMNADRWIFLLALCFICVSSNEELYVEESCEQNSDFCKTQTLSASLGSSVLLPCNFATSSPKGVYWAQRPGLDLVHLTSDGHVKFLDHRFGRVKVFPNQGSEGNYSICIDELLNSDLGCYRCKQGPDCLQVELVAEREELYVEESCEQNSDVCKTQTLSASLGSSVLLPCNFATSNPKGVYWAQRPGLDLVHLTSDGHVKFLDHRFGRVRVFPNQGSEGNYSICIDELLNSDLGCYRCKQEPDCLQVELVAESSLEGGALSKEMWLLIYICVVVAAFILLSIAGYCCIKYIFCCNSITLAKLNNPEGAEGVSAPVEETGRAPTDQQQRGASSGELVYENDDQDPSTNQDDATRNYCNPLEQVQPNPVQTQPTQSSDGIYPNLSQFQTKENLKTKQSFHREFLNRLRQASLSRHYYVNRDEISKQQATSNQEKNHPRAGVGKKKVKLAGEFNNPIYNRSTDQLNNL